MKKKFPKTETQKQINEFFENIKTKDPKEIKKIKRLAMSYNIKLGERRKLFCKKCYKPFIEPSIRIKNDLITITCEHCEHKNRWKIK
ncbi:MAG: hypothetical protein ABIH59_01535 [archaeon]